MEETNLQKESEKMNAGESETAIAETDYGKPTHVDGLSCKSAKALYTVGDIVLILGIILGVILFVFTCTTKTVTAGKFSWSDPEVTRTFNPNSLIYLVCTVLPSVIVCTFAHAVADITENTHKLANKTEKD